jgi:hypothetical protein
MQRIQQRNGGKNMIGKPRTKVLVEIEDSPEAKGAKLALEPAANAAALIQP